MSMGGDIQVQGIEVPLCICGGYTSTGHRGITVSVVGDIQVHAIQVGYVSMYYMT